MKVFKAVLCIALALAVYIFPTVANVAAHAESPSYAYVDLGKEVYFFAQKNEDSALFIIPQTYCVEILGREGVWYRVKYAEDNGIYRALYGYCLASDVTATDKPLENLYLHTTVTVVYKPDGAAGTLPAPGNIEIQAAYYGAYTIGKTDCSYVLCGENFGYIAGSVENYPLNTLPVVDTVAPAEQNSSDVTLITAIVISVVAVGAIAVLYFSGKRAKFIQSDKNT